MDTRERHLQRLLADDGDGGVRVIKRKNSKRIMEMRRILCHKTIFIFHNII